MAVLPPLAAWSVNAQSSSYSSNIVGFATVTIPPGYSILGNPLSAGLTNGANEIGLLIDGEQILTWNGSFFEFSSFDSGLGGWIDINLAPSTPPSLPPGRGFFFFNPLAEATNFTFVGQVVAAPSSTNCQAVSPGFSLISSPLPASVADISEAPVSLPLIDGMLVLTWDNATSKYVYAQYDPTLGIGNGWLDANLKSINAPGYSIGQGFFLFDPRMSAIVWCQSLP